MLFSPSKKRNKYEDLVLHKKRKRKKNLFGHWSVFVQEMRDHVKAESVWGIVTQTISSLVLICDAKAWSSKKKMKQFRPLDCLVCADRVFDFVQEMGDLKLTLKRVGVTQTISSLVLICDAKTWSPKKKMKQFRPLDCLVCADRVFDFVQEMGDLKLILKRVGVTQTISSLVFICDTKT